MESLYSEVEGVLLAGGASSESASELASYLSLHYPEHVAILLAYTSQPPVGEDLPAVE
jgi:hypothetical protein